MGTMRAHAALRGLVGGIAVVVGCATPASDVPDVNVGPNVVFTSNDMATGVDADAVASGASWARVGLRLASMPFPDREVAGWDGALRVVRWPSGEIVEGTWAYDAAAITHHLQPARDLEEGWYAVQADLGRVGRRADRSLPVVDGWTTSRFRVGSQPLATLTYSLSNRPPDSNVIDIACSENAVVSDARRLTEHLSVTVDGAPRACAPLVDLDDVFGPSRPFSRMSVECGFVPSGALVEVTMREGLTDVPLTDYRGNAPPRWSFRVGEDPETLPADVLFASETP